MTDAWAYHNKTKHSPESVRHNAHFLDWANRPLLFKIYPDLPPIALPKDTPQSGVSALSAVATPTVPGGAAAPDLAVLTSLLFFSAGVTRRRGEFLFRAAACTGALYEIELYLACGDLAGLSAGLYHFNPGDLSLRRLRQGDFRGNIAAAAGGEDALARAPAVIIATGVYWRNAWKYQARTYRHFGWDNGTLTANLLAMAAAHGLPARLVCGFVDAEINRLLGVDTEREAALSAVALGDGQPAGAGTAVGPLDLNIVPYSSREVDYPDMREMHAASSLELAVEARAWREAASGFPEHKPALDTRFIPLQPLSDADMPADTIEQVVLRRGSSRRFTGRPIRFVELSTILDRATRGIPADFLAARGGRLNELYLIVNAVDGLEPGAYYFDAEQRRLETLSEGDFRAQAAFLALEQQLAGDAAVAVFFLADLERCLRRLGNRGYRAAQLEAGILGGKIYLGAYALHLGATGLTFYDDEVTRFFSPHAHGKSAVFLTAIGSPAGNPLP
ncbi:MAG TPA: SagB/ThcOx family dehydrogenase [Bryobacteraceae bacterium]|nr:SagB/ThcOx family dehydrogenase [Bryobacteraceae bacterium]